MSHLVLGLVGANRPPAICLGAHAHHSDPRGTFGTNELHNVQNDRSLFRLGFGQLIARDMFHNDLSQALISSYEIKIV